jgi:hypothetical protein
MSHDPSPPHIIGPMAQPTPVPRSDTAPIGARQSHRGHIDAEPLVRLLRYILADLERQLPQVN